jgi:hypothetical protein
MCVSYKDMIVQTIPKWSRSVQLAYDGLLTKRQKPAGLTPHPTPSILIGKAGSRLGVPIDGKFCTLPYQSCWGHLLHGNSSFNYCTAITKPPKSGSELRSRRTSAWVLSKRNPNITENFFCVSIHYVLPVARHCTRLHQNATPPVNATQASQGRH